MGSGLLSEQYVGDYISKTRVGETCSQNILGLLHNDMLYVVRLMPKNA